MQEDRDISIKYVPKRILMVDGDISLMYAIRDALSAQYPGISVVVKKETSNLKLKGEEFNLVLLDDPEDDTASYDSNTIRTIKIHSPDAHYIYLSKETDLHKLTQRAVAATKAGAIDYRVKPEKTGDGYRDIVEFTSSMIFAYNDEHTREARLEAESDPQYALDEILEERMAARSPLISMIEDDLKNMLKKYGGMDSGELESRAKSEMEGEHLMAALSNAAIDNFYNKGRLGKALELLEEAGLIADKIESPTPSIIRGQIMSALSQRLVKMSHEGYEIGLERPAGFTQELIREVERDVGQFRLKKPIRPTRGNVAFIKVGGTKIYRREDPDENAILKEDMLHQFYRRISRRMNTVENFMMVPDSLGVVKSHEGDSWVFYREMVRGNILLDELRTIRRGMQQNGGGDNKNILKKKQFLLSSAVKQCACVLAAGPVGLADEVKNPLDSYYDQRLEERIINPFERLFAKAGVRGLSAQDIETLRDSSRPVHEWLAALEPAFYKDCWYANTILRRKGKGIKMYHHDFGSVKRLPLVIDLATLLSYGDYVVGEKARKNATEKLLVEEFLTEYSGAVELFNQVVTSYDHDCRLFMLDEMELDIESHPTERPEDIEALRQYLGGVSFEEGLDKVLQQVDGKIKRKQLSVSQRYLDDLRMFFDNLKRKPELKLPEMTTPEYKNIASRFRTDYYASLYHRGLLLAGTPCNFILSRMEPQYSQKRQQFLQEMVGTLNNSLRGIDRFYHRVNDKKVMDAKARNTAVHVIRAIRKRVNNILKHHLL
jgi:hypothetical protein